jgi:lysophospholipase L1-like esterase
MSRQARLVLAASLVTWMCALPAAARTGEGMDGKAYPYSSERNFHPRGILGNSRIRFERDGEGHVAFIGGSITEMNGYRPMVADMLKKRFPRARFTFTAAGISSTCSTTGAFRLEADVLSKGPVDLFFVEFAVNDDQDAGHARRECIRGMEGIIRHTRRHNPNADIVITHFVNAGMIRTIQAGKKVLSASAHEAVAEHYRVPTIHLAREVAEQITDGRLTWKKFGGVHPAPHGNAICTGMIDKLLKEAWAEPLAARARRRAHDVPTKPLDQLNYERGRFVDPKDAVVRSGWVLGVPEWKKLRGSKRGRFTNIPVLSSCTPGDELELVFDGTAVGAYVVAGPDAGTLEASVDSGEAVRVNLFHRYSRGLHYPRTVMFATDLAPGRHTLRLRVSGETKSSGTAARIMQFAVN